MISTHPKTAIALARTELGFGNKTGLASTWVLTLFEHRGQAATKEFMKWRPTTLQEKRRMAFSTPPWLEKPTPGRKDEAVIGDNGQEISLRSLPTCGTDAPNISSTSNIPLTPASDGDAQCFVEALAA